MASLPTTWRTCSATSTHPTSQQALCKWLCNLLACLLCMEPLQLGTVLTCGLGTRCVSTQSNGSSSSSMVCIRAIVAHGLHPTTRRVVPYGPHNFCRSLSMLFVPLVLLSQVWLLTQPWQPVPRPGCGCAHVSRVCTLHGWWHRVGDRGLEAPHDCQTDSSQEWVHFLSTRQCCRAWRSTYTSIAAGKSARLPPSRALDMA